MGLFNGLFSNSKKLKYNFADEPHIFFGRYTDRNKTILQYDHWQKSLQLYRDKKYLTAFEHFFYYLEDDSIQNVSFHRANSRINFEFIQGSKIVKGSLNDQEVFAEAEVVRFDDNNIAVMRRLLQANNQLYFSKFAIKNDVYSLKYFSPIEDASPKSLYNALRELATEADLFDDVLIDEFENVHPINMEHIKEISIEEKTLKLKYFRMWVEQLLKRIDRLDTVHDSLKVSRILQVLLLKIYYLLAPEGLLLEEIKSFQKSLSESNDTESELNLSIVNSLKQILEKPNEELMKFLYRVKSTFAVNRPTSFNYVKAFVNNELEIVDSYVTDSQRDDALDACEYILSYSSFSFGMPSVANDLLQIVWRVFNTSYFTELGFVDEYYLEENNELNAELISAKINLIISSAKKHHVKIKFRYENIDFSNQLKFAISFFKEFQYLNYD